MVLPSRAAECKGRLKYFNKSFQLKENRWSTFNKFYVVGLKIVNSVASFLKFVISIKGGQCEYSARVPQIAATALNTDGRYHSRLPVRLHTYSRNHEMGHMFVRISIYHEDP
jgi:hypothetical protein